MPSELAGPERSDSDRHCGLAEVFLDLVWSTRVDISMRDEDLPERNEDEAQ